MPTGSTPEAHRPALPLQPRITGCQLTSVASCQLPVVQFSVASCQRVGKRRSWGPPIKDFRRHLNSETKCRLTTAPNTDNRQLTTTLPLTLPLTCNRELKRPNCPAINKPLRTRYLRFSL